MPSEPVLVGSSGTAVMSGCPGRPSIRRRRCSLSKSSLPTAASTAYTAGASWPLEEKQTSSPSRISRCSHDSRSMTENDVPMWPEPASMIDDSALIRDASATACARTTGSSIARSRSSASGPT